MVESLRIFAAVAPPTEVRQALVDHLSRLRIPGRLVPPANWHLTLRFLGDVDRVTCERYIAALDQSDRGSSFRLQLSGLGAFPKPRKATVVWVGVGRGDLRLAQLAETADEAAADAGIAEEDRPFAPHLTVSRVRPPQDVTSLVTEGEIDMEWRVDRIVLFESLIERGRIRYEPLESFSIFR